MGKHYGSHSIWERRHSRWETGLYPFYNSPTADVRFKRLPVCVPGNNSKIFLAGISFYSSDNWVWLMNRVIDLILFVPAHFSKGFMQPCKFACGVGQDYSRTSWLACIWECFCVFIFRKLSRVKLFTIAQLSRNHRSWDSLVTPLPSCRRQSKKLPNFVATKL